MNLKLKHYILVGILILVCIYQQLFPQLPIVEGYQSYDECVNQGYPLNFCLQVPAQAYMGALPVG